MLKLRPKKVKEYFYDDHKIVNDGVYPHRIGIAPVKIPNNTIDIKQVYDIYFKYKGAAAGYFGQTIRPLPDEEFSIFQSELARNMNELSKWNEAHPAPKTSVNEPIIFVTGYHYANVKHSIEKKILGWRTQPRKHEPQRGNYVFVYDYDNHRIEAGFRILAESNNRKSIWEEEINSQTNELEFPYR